MAGLISQATLEQIRSASEISEVIGAVVPLKRAGANFVALCPFHKEKSPSFNVNPHRQIFHCFGCHKGGDVFTFVKEYENVSFVEAIRRLAERARIPIETDRSPASQQQRFLKELLLEIHEQIAQRWQNALQNEASGAPARQYLARRGVSPEAIKLFRLGFAPDAWDDTVNWSKAKGYNQETMEQTGLIVRKEDETQSRCYDRFRGRLMFPICDEQGRVIGFSGRLISGEEKVAKYVNSPETPIFTKGKVFFGLDKSKRAILDAQYAIICEGQLDLIACFMAGVKNVVAPQGTAFTADHARILKRYADEVVLCFDSDNAGQNATARVLDSLLNSGLAIRVATVPAPHDPDSFIKESGGPAFKALVEQAQGFFDFYLDHLCRLHNAKSDKGQTAIVRAMADAVQKTANAVLIDTYAQKTALRLSVPAEVIRREFQKTFNTSPSLSRSEKEADANAVSEQTEMEPPPPQEFWLLKLLLLHDDLAEWLHAHLDLNWIQHPAVKDILSLRLSRLHCEGPAALHLLPELTDPNAHGLVTEILAEDRSIPNPQQQLTDLLLRLRNQHFDRQIARLIQQTSLPETTQENHVALLQQQMALRRLKQQPLSPLADTE